MTKVACRETRRVTWDAESEIEVYKYLRHIFGAKCAPTCSNYALLRTAEGNGLQYRIAARAVKRNFNMDDFFKSVKTTNDALQRQLFVILSVLGLT